MANNSIDQLEERLGADWKHIRVARQLAETTRADLRRALADHDTADASVVVSGSLARDEFTTGSDIDWTLLIDGAADWNHHDLAAKIRAEIDKVAAKPTGAEGTFGRMVFSHDLIHQIGGEDDTNRNTTRRVLLLMESKALGREDAHDRVVRNILNRYLLEDRGFWAGSQYRVPRFLQNDLARYWRTMAVDFAYKHRDRLGKGWAIRNLKLRMSRKLIYVAGLMACFDFHLTSEAENWKSAARDQRFRHNVVENFQSTFRRTPLELVAAVLLRFDHLDKASRDVYDSYNAFLGMLADESLRKGLEDLAEDQADGDQPFQDARKLSHKFRDGLLTIFFDEKSPIKELTQNYGVF